MVTTTHVTCALAASEQARKEKMSTKVGTASEKQKGCHWPGVKNVVNSRIYAWSNKI